VPGANFDDEIANETESQTVGDGLRQRDPNQRQERGNGFRVIASFNPDDVLHRHRADNRQRRRGERRISKADARVDCRGRGGLFLLALFFSPVIAMVCS
jgi:hypothetical protein